MSEPRRREATHNFAFHDHLEKEESFKEAFLAGMRAPQKAIPCRFLYDARGSALFDEICDLPDYYLTRTETALLEAHAPEVAELAGPGAVLIELGSGSSVKTRFLLDQMPDLAAYMPVDVSRAHLRHTASALAGDYPSIPVEAICADYSADFPLPAIEGRRVAFFPGSTIGNLEHEEATSLLARWRKRVGESGLMIVGADLKKDPARLVAAYDDPSGVTEAFIKNILLRANRELDADFDPGRFAYDARWNEDRGRIEMWLSSCGAQTVTAAGRTFSFADGEAVHVENSHKYDLEGFAALAGAAGFVAKKIFIDPQRLFSIHVLAA